MNIFIFLKNEKYHHKITITNECDQRINECNNILHKIPNATKYVSTCDEVKNSQIHSEDVESKKVLRTYYLHCDSIRDFVFLD
jgi:hypothetical protein